MAEDQIEKLKTDIERFLEVYKVLPPEGKAAFEAQMNSAVNKVDEKSKVLYYALLQSAKNDEEVGQAIDKLHQTSQNKLRF